MGEFRHQLQREFMSRMARNPAYSLRAFARQLNISHATLSSMLSGRRKITPSTVDRLGKALGLSPAAIERFASDDLSYTKIDEDVFASLSVWYLDAILELTRIKKFKMEPKAIARVLAISVVQASAGIETLQRLGLLEKIGARYSLTNNATSTVLGAEYTTSAQKTLQKSILEKSIGAVDQVPREKRSHTSMTMAIDTADLPKVREMIAKFRREVDRFVQRDGFKPDQVYQLQISLFPLSDIEGDSND